jgi:hypothetical protein
MWMMQRVVCCRFSNCGFRLVARWWEMVREAEMPPTTVRPISETMHHGGNPKMGRGGSGLVRQISFVAVIRLK